MSFIETLIASVLVVGAFVAIAVGVLLAMYFAFHSLDKRQ